MIGNVEAGVRELLEEFMDVVPADPLAPLDLKEHRDDLVLELEERFGVSVAAGAELRSISAITALVTKSRK
jgi:hypothetical protein